MSNFVKTETSRRDGRRKLDEQGEDTCSYDKEAAVSKSVKTGRRMAQRNKRTQNDFFNEI